MTADFPALCPTSRSYTAGQYPTKKFGSLNGASVVRLYGSKPYDAEMNLTFVTDGNGTKALIDSWNASLGGFEALNVPSSVFEGAGAELDSAIPSYLNWRWAETPSIESLLPGRSRVQVKLIATLDA